MHEGIPTTEFKGSKTILEQNMGTEKLNEKSLKDLMEYMDTGLRNHFHPR